jgi:hypothetical protein
MRDETTCEAHSDADDRGSMALVIYRAGYSFGAQAREWYIMWAHHESPLPDPETILAEFWAQRQAHGRPLTGEAGELARPAWSPPGCPFSWSLGAARGMATNA